MSQVYTRPALLKRKAFHHCAGCGHSVIHRLVCEIIEEMGIKEKTVGVAPCGCSVFAYDYIDVDFAESAHGRGAAVATGLKRACPEAVVLNYQGDGDLAAIGTAETIHCANRGERITTVFVNNAVYGMTGGQMAPTTLLGQTTTTSPFGRDSRIEGHPLRISEMLALLDGVVYVERTAISSPASIRKTKKAIEKAFRIQMDDLGYALVEVLSPCPVNWKMSVLESWQWVEKEMVKIFPLGIIKDTTGDRYAH